MLGQSGPNKFELDQDALLLGSNKVPLESNKQDFNGFIVCFRRDKTVYDTFHKS